MSTAVASVICALIAALLFAVAAVAQQRAAAGVATDDSFIRSLASDPRWWAGVVGDGGGYLMQAVALALGSVLVVQPILVLALVFALPLAARYSGRSINASTWATATALTAALVCFLVVGDPTEGDLDAPLRAWLAPLGIVAVLVAVAAVAGRATAAPGRRALLLGAASGLLYGVAAALTKYVTGLFDDGVLAVLDSWQTWALVSAGVIGIYVQQRAFQAGPLIASLPAVTVAEPMAAVFLGMTVLGERLRTSQVGTVVTASAVVIMCGAAVALSRAQASQAPQPTPH